MGLMRDAMIALLVLGGIITGVTLYSQSLAVNTGAANPIGNNTAFNSLARIENATRDLQYSVQSSQITGTIFDVPLIIVSSVYNLLKLITTTLMEIFTTTVTGISEALFLPPWVTGLVMAAIGVLFVFAIIAAALRWEP